MKTNEQQIGAMYQSLSSLTGDMDSGLAARWVDVGFDAVDAYGWCNVGVCSPECAARLRDSGVDRFAVEAWLRRHPSLVNVRHDTLPDSDLIDQIISECE